MSDIAIKIEQLSKQYRLGQLGTGTISHDLNRWWHKIRGKEDPYMGLGETNDRSTKGNSDYVWALKNINFEVAKGEVIGIIGKNGAGKSTLLKILSKVTGPSEGIIKANGRIASLLEVGTGFHPEMTGRENIYMNGTIMGMNRQEINSKLDEIVEFAGIERYVDTPVKRYSSGMTVRLGFSVAAHLEPEILIVDEVLAVGDAEFQKKAVGKMQDVSKGKGRTVIFVSHNMATIKQLTSRVIVLKNGEIRYDGETLKGCSLYLKDSLNIEKRSGTINLNDFITSNAFNTEIIDAYLLNSSKEKINSFYYREPYSLSLKIKCIKTIASSIFDIKIFNDEGLCVAYFVHNQDKIGLVTLENNSYHLTFDITNNLLPGKYFIDFGIHSNTGMTVFYLEKVLTFEVSRESLTDELDYQYEWKHGSIRLDAKFNIETA